MTNNKFFTAILTVTFVLGCLGWIWPGVEAEAVTPPGHAKKVAETRPVQKDKGSTVAEKVYDTRDTVSKRVYHPSLTGLMRAYENVNRNQASPVARAVLGQLIERRGGTVVEDVYALEKVVHGQGKKIKGDAQTRQVVMQYIEDLLGEMQDGIQDPKELSKALRLLARSLEQLEERGRAENHLRQALRLDPRDLSGYTELNALRKAQGRNSLAVFVNGDEPEFDVPPMVLNNRAMLPLRQLGKSLGANVVWNPEKREITFEREQLVVVLRVDSKVALVNGREVTLDVPPTVVQGRTLVPLRFVGEALGVNVNYLPDPGLVVVNVK